ncbi:hypothetical protein J437_LFUL007411, partial [Ladona fulva]
GIVKLPRSFPDGKIVGGKVAFIRDYPYQLSLRYHTGHICGAALISHEYALTAAHCTDGTRANDLSVKAGSRSVYAGGVLRSISQIIQHPGFNVDEMDYDISILKLHRPFDFGPGIHAISLPNSNESVEVGTLADVSGWGTTHEEGALPEYLNHVEVEVLDSEECTKGYGKITERMICAGSPGRDSCQGDSGGPLVEDDKLIGIVSFGNGCARPDYPGVYTNVSALRDWIKENIGI